MKEPSELFNEAFGGGIGSPTIHCSCGRTHHAPDGRYVSEGEEADMRRQRAASPTTVVMHDREDAVSAVEVNGTTVVRGCPCGWLAKFEDYIWNERERILRYYKARREADAKALADLSAALETSEPRT